MALAALRPQPEVVEPCFDSVTGTFPATSLFGWLTWALFANVPAVPGTWINSMPRKTLIAMGQPTAHDLTLWNCLEQTRAKVPANYMVRFDPCAGMALKNAVAHGLPFGEHAQQLDLDDPRTRDTLADYPLSEIALWMRPWIEPLDCDGYPVEFRVFVADGKVLGASNRHPQRDLPDTPAIRGYATTATRHTERLIATMHRLGGCPWWESYTAAQLPVGAVSATLDFLIDRRGNCLFLGGGRAFGAGGHPCCFARERGRIRIAGLALAGEPQIAMI